MPPGILYLFPVTLGETSAERVLPVFNTELLRLVNYFVAEDAKNARRFLKLCNYPDISKAEIAELNEHNRNKDLSALLKPLLEGNDLGLFSDAGCPGIADPGAELVHLAHQKKIKVVPLVGPSSILLTAMASGFNGQNFAFQGYLPIEKPQRVKRIKELEQMAWKFSQSQFFIETPYRNKSLFDDLLQHLDPQTLLCLGIDLTMPNEKVITLTVSEWKKEKPEIQKIPVVFGIYKG